MAVGTAGAIISGALLGGLAGGQKNQSTQGQTSSVNAGFATREEKWPPTLFQNSSNVYNNM